MSKNIQFGKVSDILAKELQGLYPKLSDKEAKHWGEKLIGLDESSILHTFHVDKTVITDSLSKVAEALNSTITKINEEES